MAVLNATNAAAGLSLDAGVYTVRVSKIEPWEQRPDAKFKSDFPQERLTLRVKGYQNNDGTPVEVFDWITLYNPMGKRSKGYQIFSAAMFGGKELPEGEPLDTDDLVGKEVQITVGPKKSGDGNTITGYLPPQPKGQSAGSSLRRVVTEDDIDAI